MKVGDMVRYRQGCLDRTGIILKRSIFGDYLVFWSKEHYAGRREQLCRPINLELISEAIYTDSY